MCPGAEAPAKLTAAPTVVRKLNELYKASVLSCQGLSLRLQRFFLDKQRLLDRIQSVTAEKLIFSHAVHTVGAGGRGVPATPSLRLSFLNCSVRCLLSEPLRRRGGLQKGLTQAPSSSLATWCAASEAGSLICVVRMHTGQKFQKPASSVGVTTDHPGVGLAACLTCGSQLPMATRASVQTSRATPPRPSRCSRLPWTRCSTAGRTVCSATTRPCCSWRGCSSSSRTRRTWRTSPSVSARHLGRGRRGGADITHGPFHPQASCALSGDSRPC